MRISHELLCVTLHLGGVGRREKLKLLTVCRKAGMAECGTLSVNDLACKTVSSNESRYQAHIINKTVTEVLCDIFNKPLN